MYQLHGRHEEWRENPDMRETLEGYAYQYLTVVPQDLIEGVIIRPRKYRKNIQASKLYTHT